MLQVNSRMMLRNWDAVYMSGYDGVPQNYHLIGTYMGWDRGAIYIGGYNYYFPAGGDTLRSYAKRLRIGSGLSPSTNTVFDFKTGFVGVGGISNPKGLLHIRDLDAGPDSPNDGASIIIGNYYNYHLELDANEIHAMADTATAAPLSLQADSGSLIVHTNMSPSRRFIITDTGLVGIGVGFNPQNKLHVGYGDVRIGEINPPGTGSVPGYGRRLYFSGGPGVISLNSENTDVIWLARHNIGKDSTELVVNIGDNGYQGGSNDAFVLQSAGNYLGIDNNSRYSPALKLRTHFDNNPVVGSINITYKDFNFINFVDVSTGTPTGKLLISNNNNNILMTITESGKVGIGTTNPFTKLHVTGWVTAITGYGDTIILGGDAAGSDAEIRISAPPSRNQIALWNRRLEKFATLKADSIYAKGNLFVLASGGTANNLIRGKLGINVTGGLGSVTNILTVQQASTTDPIADSWTVYSTPESKEIIIGPTDSTIDFHYLQLFKNIDLYQWKRTNKEPIRLSLMATSETPNEVLAYDENGNIQGIDLYGYIGFLHAVIKAQQKLIDNQQILLQQLSKEVQEIKKELNKVK